MGGQSRREMGVKRVGCQTQADLARMSVAQGGQEEGTCELRLEGLQGGCPRGGNSTQFRVAGAASGRAFDAKSRV